ncbi:hypothetical protein C3F09_09215 [candidate division GN15 bacterium]|uniref:4Fe-4S ferredoxin-type domain-containing protein n=1 Tax=candidate division GN15 bacterium TaxID=2072418 RepID=A0A855WY05_9BACT|nr:MAG: hypothetical protein C3F09_09215 [candidate division GN15 bacterium]
MTIPRTRYYRYSIFIAIIGLVTWLALGYGSRSFEAYCPFGGAESLWGLFTAGEFTCALGPLNLSIMIALLALVLLSKKSFCGWACPIGFLSELGARLGGLLWKKRPRVPGKTNNWLKLLRYVSLILALVFTYKTGELILRGYDPFYLTFSGIGHGSAGIISIIVLAVLVIGALFVPMMFCRYLCPMGAVFDPFSRLGVIKIIRDESTCTSCGKCGKACVQDIPVHSLHVIRHRDCTNCLECLDACPEKDTLQLRARL